MLDGDAFGNFDVQQRFKGLYIAGRRDGKAEEELLDGVLLGDEFDGALRAERGGAGDDHDGAGRVQTGNETDDGVVFGEGSRGGAGEVELRFAGLRVDIDDREIALARAGIDAIENKLLCAGNFAEVQILGGGADEDDVVVLGIVEREEAATLDAKLAVERTDDQIEIVDGQDFADAGVVIPNGVARILEGIEVAHAGLGASDESGIAEDDPRLVRTTKKRLPESLERRWGNFSAGIGDGSVVAGEEEHGEGGEEQNRKDDEREEPAERDAGARNGMRFVAGRLVLVRMQLTGLTMMEG